MSRVTFVSFVGLGVVAGWSIPATAAEPHVVDYAASSTCPSRAEFLSEVRARTSELDTPSRTPHTFVVRLTTARGERARGSLTIERAGRLGAPRVLEAEGCDEAAHALSFMLALVLDPDAKLPPSSGSRADEEVSPSSTAEDAPTPPPEPAPLPNVGANHAPPDRDATPTSRDHGASLRWSAGAAVDVIGLGTGPVAAGGIFVGVEPFRFLALRASLRRTLPSTVEESGTSSALTWTLARVEPCFPLLRTQRLEVGPCLTFDLGRIEGQGGGVRVAESASRFWSSGGLGGLVNLDAWGPIVVHVAAGAFVPFTRTELTYRPDLVVYRPPVVGAQGSFGAGVRW